MNRPQSFRNVDQHPPDVDRFSPDIDQHLPDVDRFSPDIDQYLPDVNHSSPILDRHSPNVDSFSGNWIDIYPYSELIIQLFVFLGINGQRSQLQSVRSNNHYTK